MDEARRREERALAAGEDRLARLRVANDHLRRGDPGAALALLPEEQESSALEAGTRARALAQQGDGAEALAMLERVVVLGLEVEPQALEAALAPALDGAIPLGRARAARVFDRLAPRGTPLPADLARDDDPLVRVAVLRDRFPVRTDWDKTSRVYGSHGPDYETGWFIAFETSLECRLRTFTARLFESVNRALAALADDRGTIERLRFGAAFGEGFGLGGLRGRNREEDQADLPVIAGAVLRLDRLDLLPWRVRLATVRPYDRMDDEARLARRLGRDLFGHPLRQHPHDAKKGLLERFLARHPLRGPAPTDAELAPLLAEARERFTPVGVQACLECTRFVRRPA
jgi:hypothetical protein